MVIDLEIYVRATEVADVLVADLDLLGDADGIDRLADLMDELQSSSLMHPIVISELRAQAKRIRSFRSLH